jgi:hypothetical protein
MVPCRRDLAGHMEAKLKRNLLDLKRRKPAA